MLTILNCPICHEEVFSSIGKGCKLCGMPLDNNNNFCCRICMRKYKTINKIRALSKTL